jgi:hypothetical protein
VEVQLCSRQGIGYSAGLRSFGHPYRRKGSAGLVIRAVTVPYFDILKIAFGVCPGEGYRAVTDGGKIRNDPQGGEGLRAGASF